MLSPFLSPFKLWKVTIEGNVFMYHIVETIRQSDYAHIRSLLLTLHVVESFVENLLKFLHLGKKIVITKQIIYIDPAKISHISHSGFELNFQSFVVKNTNKIPFSVTRMYLQLGLRVKKFWSFAYCRFLQNTSSTLIYYNGGGVHWRRTKNQVCILWDLHVNRWHTSGGSVAYGGITQAVSLKSWFIFCAFSNS